MNGVNSSLPLYGPTLLEAYFRVPPWNCSTCIILIHAQKVFSQAALLRL